VLGLIATIVVLTARVRLGVRGYRGESILFDLRDRLQAQGKMPSLPASWHVDVALRSAGGVSFSGDFIVAARSEAGHTLELALVDVSGKGMGAGSRALQLSGAFGGLLGSLPHEQFLPAANAYLLRQGWSEGFATAAHVVLDLESGDYEIFRAGHPPGVQFVAGSGRWQISEAEGALLGVLADAEYKSARGHLGIGDAFLLYTDGLIEAPGRNLEDGLDRLLGEAERLISRGFRSGARQLVDAAASGVGDDRAVVVIWRG
jgi:serine phosphatase RsbU (regulator of sigma subunit)